MQDDIASLMESDVAEKTSSSLVVGDVQLKQAANLAAMIKTETEHVKVLEENLKECKKNLMKLTDEDLPQLLTELGMSSFKMADGSSVEIKKTYGASIPVANRAQAYQWLRDNGFGDIVKNVIACNFGMGEDNEADSFFEMARDKGFVPDKKTEVHSSTLRAFVKERVENGDEFPMELFGAFVGQRAVIKGGK
jgi:hypothetical protein|tara:strand:- start:75 stop:653 length:579 start_codon:yes stop_codon:yes gene_type:complete